MTGSRIRRLRQFASKAEVLRSKALPTFVPEQRRKIMNWEIVAYVLLGIPAVAIGLGFLVGFGNRVLSKDKPNPTKVEEQK
jgi:hypothetical protein